MHGIDLVLPDFTWLRENADRIEGVVATHGHEDHVGALHYLLREMSFPIFGSAVTLGLARNRIDEAGLMGKTELIVVADGERRMIGPFDVEFIPVTHSVPHAHAIAIHNLDGHDEPTVQAEEAGLVRREEAHLARKPADEQEHGQKPARPGCGRDQHRTAPAAGLC